MAASGIGPLVAALTITGGAVLVLSVRIPPSVADLLLAANLAAAVAILMVALVTPRPVELSSFPSVVVLASLARILLCLLVARLIVTTGQAGQMATGLAKVAAANDPVASLGMLITLGIVQFVVVTAGVGRLAEVAARFALDALPGKQMALDSAITAEKLSAAASQEQMMRLEMEANFYGAMDGAGRFLRGETIATAAIVALTAAMSLVTAASQAGGLSGLALATAGHGLIILLPALLMGAGAAIMVARAGSASPLTAEVMAQLVRTPAPLAAAAVTCLLLALVPGMAKVPLLAVAAGLGLWVWALMRHEVQREVDLAAKPAQSETTASPVTTSAAPQIHVGWGLLDLITESREQFLTGLSEVRRQMSAQLGFSLPPFVVQDSATLGLHEYSFVFRGSTVARGDVFPTRQLVIGDQATSVGSVGVPSTSADGQPAAWLTAQQEQTARAQGCRLLTAHEVILEHLRRTLRQYAADLFDTQRAAEILDGLNRTHPAAVAEARAAGLTESVLAAVGRQLLKKGLSVTDSLTTVEVMTEGLATTTDAERLAASVRRAVARTSTELVAPDGTVYALQVAGEVAELLGGSRPGDAEPVVLSPEQAAAWRQLLADLVAEYRRPDRPIVLLCSEEARRTLEPITDGFVPDLVVFEPNEVLGETTVQRLHQISSDELTRVVARTG